MSLMCLADGESPGLAAAPWARMGVQGVEMVPAKVLTSWPALRAAECVSAARALRAVGLSEIPAMQGFLFRRPDALLFEAPSAFLDALGRAAAAAEAFGCPLLVWGAPWSRRRPGGAGEDRAIDTLRLAAEACAARGARLLMERVADPGTGAWGTTAAEVARVVAAVAHPAFGVQADVGSLSDGELPPDGAAHLHASEPSLALYAGGARHRDAAVWGRRADVPWASLEMAPVPAVARTRAVEMFVGDYGCAGGRA